LSLQCHTDMTSAQALAVLAEHAKIHLEDDQIYIDGTNITEKIRSAEVTRQASLVAVIPQVREKLNQLQRRVAAEGNIVTEGRDQGTVVFPQAECKFYITADKAVRAARRQHDLEQQGQKIGYNAVLADIEERDHRDETRAAAPLKPAEDAIIIDTSTLTKKQVLQKLMSCANEIIDRTEQASQ